jgi:hypothetical protein
MTLLTARTLLLDDRMDWNRAHLRWIPAGIYRLVLEARIAVTPTDAQR